MSISLLLNYVVKVLHIYPKPFLPTNIGPEFISIMHLLRILFSSIGRIIVIFYSHFVDSLIYLLYSRTLVSNNHDKLLSEIIAHYHVLEKGLAMPNRKVIFGSEVAQNLLRLLKKWHFNYELNLHIISARHVLYVYSNTVNIEGSFSKRLDQYFSLVDFEHPIDSKLIGGFKSITLSDFDQKRKASFEELVDVRNSYRSFTGQPVSHDLIRESIKIAQTSPSACNRQPWRVHWTTDPKLVKKILHYQTGNRGFGDSLGGLLIVTSDLNVYSSYKERNQAFVDGGLFSMSLIYALTFKGIGSCALNWSSSHSSNKQVHKICAIPNNQTIILMIGIGYIVDKSHVPFSNRYPLSHVSCELK